MVVGRILITLIFSFLLASPGQAVVTLTNLAQGTFSNLRGKFLNEIGAVNTEVFGGLSGSCSGSATSTCDSCAASTSTTEPCNTARIHNGLYLELIFLLEAGSTAGTIQVTNNADPATIIQHVSPTHIGLVQPGENFTVRILWSDICLGLFGNSDCDAIDLTSQSPQQLRIGVTPDTNTFDANSDILITLAKLSSGQTPLCNETTPAGTTGACNFIAYPGDSKIFLESVRTDCDFPRVDGSQADITAIRVFRTENSSGAWPNIKSPFSDVAVGEATAGECTNYKEVSLGDSEVDGLANGTLYRFAIGVVDEAFNVGYVTNMGAVYSEPPDPNSTAQCFDPDGDWTQNCHMATPAEVVGLIADEFDCFIATAAYGTALKPKVKDFREFRNRYLNTHVLGRAFVKAYYQLSPPMAQWIAQRPPVRAMVRGLLYPIWFLVNWSLYRPTSLLVSLAGVLLAVLAWRRRWWKVIL